LIDLHSHVLPGLDDGAADLEDSLAICRAAAEQGIEVLAATPHVRDDYPTSPQQMEEALARVQEAVGDLIRVVPGGELDLAELGRPREELIRFALAGNPSYLLVETPYTGWPLDFDERLFRLHLAGMTPVLAHPERNGEVQAEPERLRPLVEAGALVQVTAASLDGRLGRATRATGLALVEQELAHLLASDAHSANVRAVGMRAAAEAVGDEHIARWLATDVPAAIVEGSPLPPRPEKRRGWFGR
jgi:protein-tyrosine phosphatase